MTKKNLAITGILFLIFLMTMGIGLDNTWVHMVTAPDLGLETPGTKSKPLAGKLLSLGNEFVARGSTNETENLEDHLRKVRLPELSWDLRTASHN
jgi:hypothetical protein